jgi:glycosyltransferase involved in cell wall biosynthesis
MKNLVALIPCYNEENSIGTVISKFDKKLIKKNGFNLNIIVIDNNSKDKTAQVAKKHGATVISELKKGKGNAMRTGFSRLPKDTDYVIMLDGDDTYDPGEVLRMIEPLDSGFCDVVIGSRLGGKIHGDSMTLFNQMGNWIFTHLVRYVYRANVTDVLTGYFAWKKKSIDQLAPHLISDGFAIEMEMITKMARLKQDITSVPISYTQRSGESNLHPIRDGFRILFMFLRNLSWKPKTAIAIHRLE